MKKVTGQLEDTASIWRLRKDLARIKMLQGQMKSSEVSEGGEVRNMVTEQKQASQPKSEMEKDERNPLQKRRAVVGVVVSDKMQKTIVVKVDRQVRHSLYKKYVERITAI